ncbi:MAG: hypothetical protein JXB33_09020 [Clostridia bacterium]|nr:hypothetical protein [Clostridia bacterium]
MKKHKTILVFTILLALVMTMFMTGCTSKLAPAKALEELPERYEIYPGALLRSKTMFPAGRLGNVPNIKSDYTVFTYEVNASADDVYAFYVNSLGTEGTFADGKGEIALGYDVVKFITKGGFVDIIIYVEMPKE